MSTLVIGARGNIGRHVVDQLLSEGEPVRAGMRRPVVSSVEAVRVDLDQPATLPPALDGVRNVFLYASSRSIEAFTAASGLRWTPVRPLVLATNALNWAGSIRATGTVPVFRPDSTTAPVHERDVAAVAVAALRGATGVSELLTGPELVTSTQQVALVGDALGRVLRVEELTETQARQRFGATPETEAVLRFIIEATRGGSPRTDTVERVLGRPGVPFAHWAREHAGDFR